MLPGLRKPGLVREASIALVVLMSCKSHSGARELAERVFKFQRSPQLGVSWGGAGPLGLRSNLPQGECPALHLPGLWLGKGRWCWVMAMLGLLQILGLWNLRGNVDSGH